MENSIEETIKIIERKIKEAEHYLDITGLCLTLDEELCNALMNILSDYKKVVKENEELKILKMENKRECMEIIVAVAIKTKEGEVLVSRYSHSELMSMFPDKFKNAEQGFLTSKCRFVNREESFKIANRYNQIVIKDNTQNELYSEDIFLNEHMQKNKIERLQKENKELKEEIGVDYTTVYLKGVYDEREKMQKENEQLRTEVNSLEKEKAEYLRQLDLDYVDKNFIPKQEVKDKIEELDERIKNPEKNSYWASYTISECIGIRRVLQELLELSELNSEFNSEGKSVV